MATHGDISDPTDWLNTPVASLQPLETGLRCEICKDFYVAPVITACCHTFCSGCIRRSLSSVNASRKCPLCWAPFDEGQLRKNKVVEELVKTFQAARGDVLAMGWAIRDGALEEMERGKKRKLSEIDTADIHSNGPSPRKTRSQTHHRSRVVSNSEEPEEHNGVQNITEENQTDDGRVSCPICQQRMMEAQVFPHLDTHSVDSSTTITPTMKLGLPNRTHNAVSTMNSLPTLSYTLLNDLQLRRRLRELGIPCDGNKQIMSRRHTEWRNLVNANCDSSNCKSKTELLKELNQWERIQNYTNHPQIGKTTKNLVMEKDFDRDNWSSSHGVDFQNLIAAAKSKAKQDMQKKSGTLDGDDVDRPAKSIDRDATNGKPLESTTTAIISSSQVQDISSLISSEETPKVGDFGVS